MLNQTALAIPEYSWRVPYHTIEWEPWIHVYGGWYEDETTGESFPVGEPGYVARLVVRAGESAENCRYFTDAAEISDANIARNAKSLEAIESLIIAQLDIVQMSMADLLRREGVIS